MENKAKRQQFDSGLEAEDADEVRLCLLLWGQSRAHVDVHHPHTHTHTLHAVIKNAVDIGLTFLDPLHEDWPFALACS